MKKNNKGFTLAELLIVVAIIAVLVAIAIPIFTTQLEKSRDAVSVSNLRSAYAEAMTEVLTYTSDKGGDGDHLVITKSSGTDGTSYTVLVRGVVIKTQKADNWNGLSAELPWNQGKTTGLQPDDGGSPIQNATVTFIIDDGGAVTSVSYS